MRSACVEVPVERGEEVRRRLLEMDALRRDLRIERSGDRLYLPVTIPVDIGLPVLEREFPAGFTLVRSYRDLVHIPPRLAPLLPKAFDEIGDIVVLRLPEELVGFEREIGEAILRWSPKEKTRTEHVEFGLRYLVDVERAYFSPRLGSERSRVADQVNAGEVIVDLFAGVGPYAVLIARTREPKVVHAIDANPAAVELLRENVRKNRADGVIVHEGSGQEILPHLAPVDRVIMDLPRTAREFLPAVVPHVRDGGIVHLYTIADRDLMEEAKADAVELARRGGRGAEVLASRVVRGYSPGKVHVALDLRIV